jgi:hypothetical protein
MKDEHSLYMCTGSAPTGEAHTAETRAVCHLQVQVGCLTRRISMPRRLSRVFYVSKRFWIRFQSLVAYCREQKR